ncbi:hypothetical protein [uncultured Clostridium sp.]|nr:hypothetical protein [uncultured Clostridium sp.]
MLKFTKKVACTCPFTVNKRTEPANVIYFGNLGYGAATKNVRVEEVNDKK